MTNLPARGHPTRPRTAPRRRPGWPTQLVPAALVLSLLALPVAPACADGISVRTVELEAVEDGYLLDANFDLELTPTLQDAVSHGVTLDFVMDFELWRPRAWWFDESLTSLHEHRRLSYVPITRMYRLNIGNTYETFPDLHDALRALTHVHVMPSGERIALHKGMHYEGSVSLRLDTTQLPKPLQIETLSSREWQLASPIHRFAVTPG